MRDTDAQVYPWNDRHYTVNAGSSIGDCKPIRSASGAPSHPYRTKVFQQADSNGVPGSWKWELWRGTMGEPMDFGYQDTEGEAWVKADKALYRTLIADTQAASDRANKAYARACEERAKQVVPSVDQIASVYGKTTAEVQGKIDALQAAWNDAEHKHRDEQAETIYGTIETQCSTPESRTLRRTLRRRAVLLVEEMERAVGTVGESKVFDRAIKRLLEVNQLAALWTLLNGDGGEV